MDYIGVELAGLPADTLAQIEPLLVMLKTLNEQIKSADKRVEEIAKADEVVQRLCSVPGVSPVVATTFAATLDDSSRFLGAKHVRSYLGLVPREYSSGERQRRGRISKARSVRARSLLVGAALALRRWKRVDSEYLFCRSVVNTRVMNNRVELPRAFTFAANCFVSSIEPRSAVTTLSAPGTLSRASRPLLSLRA